MTTKLAAKKKKKKKKTLETDTKSNSKYVKYL